MRHLPIFLGLEAREALVVGGGPAAAARVRHLLAAGARVRVVAPGAGAEIEELAAGGEIDLARRRFRDADTDGAAIVFSATGVSEVDERVAQAARRAGVPVNVADRAGLSDFIMPAIIDRDPVLVAISTGGAAPALARALRARIERLLPARLGRLARFAERFRGAVAATVAEPAARRRFWENFFDGPVAESLLRGERGTAGRRMLTLVNGGHAAHDAAAGAAEGVVYLVGAGPGDADLLTLRAVRLLERADVVVHDRLAGPDILNFARREAERIYVGKAKADHAMSQDEINALLVARAREGKQVVRLKGGDPFIFGRGGEELDALDRAGIRAEVVPGITAAAGCAASAGIPLTHRDHAGAVTFISGHRRDGEPDYDWAALARGGQTIVVYMGLSTAGAIAGRLIAHGMDPATPAAMIENGTRPDERVVPGVLADLGRMAAEHGIAGPALLVIGEVARVASARGLADAAPVAREAG